MHARYKYLCMRTLEGPFQIDRICNFICADACVHRCAAALYVNRRPFTFD